MSSLSPGVDVERDLHESARLGTRRVEVGGELGPISGIPSGRRRTPLRRGTQSGSTGRKRVKSVLQGSEPIGCLNKPARVAADRPDHVARYHRTKRSHEIARR